MDLQTVPKPALFTPRSMADYIQQLRRYEKDSIVDAGRHALWSLFLKRKTIFDKPSIEPQLLKSYGSRVIALALATGNNHRHLKINHPHEFKSLYDGFLHIPCTISSQEFMDDEAVQICDELKKLNIIPSEFISYDSIRPYCSDLFFSRGISAQHQTHHSRLDELYTDWMILNHMDKLGAGIASSAIKAAFGLDIIQVVRSGFALFAMAREKHGILNFDKFNSDAELKEKMQIDSTTCHAVARITSYPETALREKWLQQEVLTLPELYQKFAPDPFYKCPMVHLDKKERFPQAYLMPSPFLFIRTFRQAVFSKVFEHGGNKGTVGDILGAAIEAQVYTALCSMFGTEKVTRVEGAGKRADFHVTLDKMNLVIETKTNIGNFSRKATMTPAGVAEVWSRLYEASEQCAASLRQLKVEGKPTLALILVAEHMTGEPMPFQAFAMRTGLYKALGLREVEFLTLNTLEYILSSCSLEEFQKVLSAKWTQKNPLAVGDILTLKFYRDAPTHNYEYLQAAEDEVFAKQIQRIAA